MGTENKNSPLRRRAVLCGLISVSVQTCVYCSSIIQTKNSRPSQEKWASDDGHAATQMGNPY
jgi:hypothetical protein